MDARISVSAADESAVDCLAKKLELPHFIATTLVARGIDTVEKAQAFLHPNLETDWHDPYDIDGMDDAVNRIARAITSEEHILVYGDFDLDGISATTLMTRGLRACGAHVTPFIPLRFEEGYGLSKDSIARLEKHEPNLVVTVDNGIASKYEVELLLERGIDVVITDHHEPADLVPDQVPVVDPKCSENPSSILAGAGVALKVTQAVGARFGKPHLWRSLLDLATLGTVADLMPMREQNRALVTEGLRMINENPRPCIAALLKESGFADRLVTSSNLSFTLVPRLNAAGRMGNAQLALDLLFCDDSELASQLAAELENTNMKRRQIESELAEVASVQAEEVYTGQRALVVAGEGWHEGVKGIVASRLANRYGVPTLLFTIEGDEAHGSGRSVGDVNLFQVVSECQDILIRYGGHHAAVGVTLKADKLPEFTERLCAYMDALPQEDFIPRIEVDASVDLVELTLSNVEKLDLIAPFGQENSSPHFLAHGVMMAGGRAVGAEKNHLSCTLTDGVHSLNCIMFHCSNVSALLRCDSALDAVFELQIDTWKGRRSVKAVLSSLSPLMPCIALESVLETEDKNFVSGLIANGDAERDMRDISDWEGPESDRQLWQKRAQIDPGAFRQDLIQAFLGDENLHAAQKTTLALLDEGKSVFTVMGTGRGKSLIFYIYAAQCALGRNEVSLFVYPLRALVADQAFHLERTLGSFGLRIGVLTGALSQSERVQVMGDLEEGLFDIVLTTPEYLECHADEIARASSIGFVVIDEAHHVGTSKAGFRPSYARLGETLAHLHYPQVLALSATATKDITDDIVREFSLDELVFDNTERSNLMVVDQRNHKKRERYLASLVAQGEKTLIYVNSRMESITLVRKLRKQEPHIASLIGFYNAGLSRAERERVETLFREGKLQVLVATSAFGEGVDIPGVRHVVLYHLPFSGVEFNQMSGRAGRDGDQAYIHLLFGKSDVSINTLLLYDIAPSHDSMAQIYRSLRSFQNEHDNSFFTLDEQDIAHRATRLFGSAVSPKQVHSGISVFEELGLVKVEEQNAERHSAFGDSLPITTDDSLDDQRDKGSVDRDQADRRIYVVDYEGKVELSDSVRYREGLDEYNLFISFKDWVLTASVDQLQDRIRHPLLPYVSDKGEG